MQQFSMSDANTVLCDTHRCWAEVQTLGAGQSVRVADQTAEVVICVVDGALTVHAGAELIGLSTMQGVQIPAGLTWSAVADSEGTKILRVDSFHAQLTPETTLMTPLTAPHRFAVADNEWLVYDDYVRGGVLTFAPKFVADKHFHQDADEIFWFFEGTCRVTGPDETVLAPAGTIILTPSDEWHIIENVGDEPLLMFLTVTPNIVPSHTFINAAGKPFVRSDKPLSQAPRR